VIRGKPKPDVHVEVAREIFRKTETWTAQKRYTMYFVNLNPVRWWQFWRWSTALSDWWWRRKQLHEFGEDFGYPGQEDRSKLEGGP